MSLHKFAEQVASQGRGDDSLLVHMTPDEVRRLQAFAEANGTTMTINPDTGLPEAGMLSELFKAVAPIALGAFLGPAGFGLSATMAGVATGGITALATGSLSRGLMAGLGAYGGAGLADSFMNAGASTVGNVAGALGVEGAATGAGSQAAMLAAQNAGFGAEGLSSLADSARVAAGAAPVVPSTSSLLSSGAQAAMTNPMQFAKDNWKYLAGAAAPIAADLMTPTTTKMPELGNTGYIRQKIYDPYTQTYTSMAPVKANEWGARQFSDIHRGYNGGGIVALAGGGNFSTIQEGDEYDQYNDGSAAAAATKAAADAAAAVVIPPQGIATEQGEGITRLGNSAAGALPPNQLALNTQFVQQAAQPSTTAAQFLSATSGAGIYNQDLADALAASGLSAGAQYAATHTLEGTAGTQGGLAGLSANINAALTGAPNATLTDAQKQMTKYDITDADFLRATGQTSGDIFAGRDAAAKAAADKAAAEAARLKAIADAKAIADKAAADKAAADKAAADKAAADKIIADKIAADKFAADKAAADKIARDKAAADKIIADKIAADKVAADKIARDKAIADKAAADAAAAKVRADAAAADKIAAAKVIADAAAAAKIAAEKAAADAAAKALAEGKTLAEATAAAAKAKLEADAIARAAADKAAADAAAAANKVTSIGTVDLLTNTGVTQDKTDTTTLGTNTLATTTPGAIKSNITTDGTYVGTSGPAAVVGTKVGQGVISGTGTETSTGTTGPIIDYGGTAGFSTAPLTLANTQITQQAAATNAAQNTQLHLYRSWIAQNPSATPLQEANFLDKINLSPDIASKATGLSGQQMKNRYYDAKYNKMTGDSESAYNFLMGKGAYPTKSGVGEIMRPYSEATLGMPASTNQKYIFDPTTRSYKLNQDYVGTTRDSTGAVNYTMSPKEITDYFKANNGQFDNTTYDWAIENGVSPEQIAASTGMPLSTVAAKWRDAKAKKDKAAAEAKAASLFTDQSGSGSSDSGGGPGGTGPGGVGGAGGPGSTTASESIGPAADSGDNDAVGGYYSRGKLNYRAKNMAMGGATGYALGGLGSLGSYSDGGRLLRGPGDGVSDSIPATIGAKQQPARLADGEFVIPARIVSELGNGSTDAGAKKLYAMMDRVQRARGKTTGKDKVAANSRADKHLPA